MPFACRLVVIFALSLMLLPARATANDAVAGLAAGELVLGRSDAVEMAEEELYLSRDEVRVRYVFRNHSGAPVETLVAFPLPPIHMEQEYEYGFGPAHRDPGDPVNFRAWVNGNAVPVALDVNAVTPEGRDVTALLERWQIPPVFLAPDEAAWERLWSHLDSLPQAARVQLGAAGAILDPDEETGFTPNWIVQYRYYWRMRFPPGAGVEVRHSYTPVPEAFVFGRDALDEPALVEEACMDPGFRRAVLARFGPDEYAATTGWLLRYVLTTANSWRGPIGRFHLIVDKGSPGALVSLCRDGIRKTGPTTFEWWAQAWVPRRDLALLFLAPPG